MARLYDYYKETIVTKMMEQFEYKNPLQVPRLKKIVLNMGVSEGARDKDAIEEDVTELAAICGQRPIVTRAKRSIASFKVRAGMSIGCKATIRGKRMYEFLDRLVNVAIPRIRDFRGLPPVLDGRGNYNVGLQEIIVFPEVNLDKVKRTFGLNVTMVTSAKTDEEARTLLELLGVPFRRV